jgi:hypothetical protein
MKNKQYVLFFTDHEAAVIVHRTRLGDNNILDSAGEFREGSSMEIILYLLSTCVSIYNVTNIVGNIGLEKTCRVVSILSTLSQTTK